MSQEEVTTEYDIPEIPINTTSGLYERKRHSKAIRVLTVFAYVLSVSLAAILLSIYYLFVWDGHPTLARFQPEATVALGSNVEAYIDGSRVDKEDLEETLRLSPPAQPTIRERIDVRKRIVDCQSKSSESRGKGESRFEKQSTEATSSDQNFYQDNAINETFTDASELQIELNIPESVPTVSFDIPATEINNENSTWYSEFDDFNSDYRILSKRSVFMRKLIGNHETILK